MRLLRNLNLLLRLLLELALVASAFYVGQHVTASSYLRWALALGLPLLVIMVWGMYIAPKSSKRLAKRPRIIVELCLFCVAVVGLVAIKQPVAAAGMAVAVTVNEILLQLWEK